jgi:hypothetical protein
MLTGNWSEHTRLDLTLVNVDPVREVGERHLIIVPDQDSIDPCGRIDQVDPRLDYDIAAGISGLPLS